MVYADIRGGSSGWGRQMTLGMSSAGVYGDFDGYFFGNLVIRPAILYDDMLSLVGL